MANVVRSWTRLEPVLIDPTLNDGLRAEIADPLWLLARQWQFGEFAAEDAGSPAWVQISTDISTLTRYLPKPPDGSPGQLVEMHVPLETRVEAERPQGSVDLAWAVRAGRHYLRLLDTTPGLDAYKAALVQQYPVATTAPAADPLLALTASRSPDGVAMAAAFRAALSATPPTLPAAPPPPAAQTPAVLTAAQTWLAWYDGVTEQALGAEDAWLPTRLEYQPTLSSPGVGTGELVFSAAAHAGGALDWWNFDIDTTAGHGLGAISTDLPPADAGVPHAALVSPVTFGGMPAPRFWQIEDAAANLSEISITPDDMIAVLLVDYALRYGNDFYLVPLPLDVGAVCKVASLIVSTTFGDNFLIPSAATVDGEHGRFRLFEHATVDAHAANGAPRNDVFVLFPTAADALNGPTVEDVHLLRDNVALLAWGVERIITGPDGNPRDRTSDVASGRSPAPAAAPTGAPTAPQNTGPSALSYHLATEPPSNWVPLLPQLDSNSITTLARGGNPAGRFLSEINTPLPDEEVTQAGVQLTRRWRYTRWIDGSHHAWIGRSVQAGRGPGSSGLRFDITEPDPPPPG